MKVLEIVTGYNRTGINPKTGRPWVDATGAFLPEAHAFRRLHGEPEQDDGHTVPKTGWLAFVAPLVPARRRGLAESSIRTTPGLEVLAAFGHGTTSSLICTGHTLRQVDALADAIRSVAAGVLTVVLYACSTGTGKTGFADVLADRLTATARAVNVFAHTTPGHATWNPRVELSGGPRAGDAIVAIGEPLWKRWRERLAEDQVFRLSFWQPAHGLSRDAAREIIRASI